MQETAVQKPIALPPKMNRKTMRKMVLVSKHYGKQDRMATKTTKNRRAAKARNK